MNEQISKKLDLIIEGLVVLILGTLAVGLTGIRQNLSKCLEVIYLKEWKWSYNSWTDRRHSFYSITSYNSINRSVYKISEEYNECLN